MLKRAQYKRDLLFLLLSDIDCCLVCKFWIFFFFWQIKLGVFGLGFLSSLKRTEVEGVILTKYTYFSGRSVFFWTVTEKVKSY